MYIYMYACKNVNLMKIYVKVKIAFHPSPSLSWILMNEGMKVGNTINCNQKVVVGAGRPQRFFISFFFFFLQLAFF